jgi:hypothetical protein
MVMRQEQLILQIQNFLTLDMNQDMGEVVPDLDMKVVMAV